MSMKKTHTFKQLNPTSFDHLNLFIKSKRRLNYRKKNTEEVSDCCPGLFHAPCTTITPDFGQQAFQKSSDT